MAFTKVKMLSSMSTTIIEFETNACNLENFQHEKREHRQNNNAEKTRLKKNAF